MKHINLALSFVVLSLLTCISAAAQFSPFPILLTNGDSSRALALDAVTFMAKPFQPRSNLTPNRRTRMALFAQNIDRRRALTVEAVEVNGVGDQLPVESLSTLPELNWIAGARPTPKPTPTPTPTPKP